MLEVQQLAVNYRGVCGLDAISFQLRPGELVGIIGPHGAGKKYATQSVIGFGA
ncbi:MAG TPA: hypothetical protein V6D19_04795 [Stenomitos sp.]